MIDDFQNVLYTPIDTPPFPKVDGYEIYKWVEDNYNRVRATDFSTRIREQGLTAENGFENYPWKLTYAYYNSFDEGPGWVFDFEDKFPQVTSWLFSAFGLTEDDVGGVMLLPTKKDYVGHGFWHRDMDTSGLRVYFEFENWQQDKLFMKRSKIPYAYNEPPHIPVPITEEIHDDVYQNEVIECEIISNQYCFYLNNYRAIHQTWTSKPNTLRMAAIIFPKQAIWNDVAKKTGELIVRSANKFKDQAIVWKPE